MVHLQSEESAMCSDSYAIIRSSISTKCDGNSTMMRLEDAGSASRLRCFGNLNVFEVVLHDIRCHVYKVVMVYIVALIHSKSKVEQTDNTGLNSSTNRTSKTKCRRAHNWEHRRQNERTPKEKLMRTQREHAEGDTMNSRRENRRTK